MPKAIIRIYSNLPVSPSFSWHAWLVCNLPLYLLVQYLLIYLGCRNGWVAPFLLWSLVFHFLNFAKDLIHLIPEFSTCSFIPISTMTCRVLFLEILYVYTLSFFPCLLFPAFYLFLVSLLSICVALFSLKMNLFMNRCGRAFPSWSYPSHPSFPPFSFFPPCFAEYQNHWNTLGLPSEGRQAHPLFAPQQYAQLYSDLAILGNNYTALAEHYLTNGIYELRNGYVSTPFLRFPFLFWQPFSDLCDPTSTVCKVRNSYTPVLRGEKGNFISVLVHVY